MLDVGCHPGGWAQVAVEEVGEGGLVIGVDLLATSPVDGASIIIGDITEEDTIARIRQTLGERGLNVVVSDISPNLTGRYDTDQTISLELATLVLDAAMEFIPPWGRLRYEDLPGHGYRGSGRRRSGSLLQRPEVLTHSKSECLLGDLSDLSEQVASTQGEGPGEECIGAGADPLV